MGPLNKERDAEMNQLLVSVLFSIVGDILYGPIPYKELQQLPPEKLEKWILDKITIQKDYGVVLSTEQWAEVISQLKVIYSQANDESWLRNHGFLEEPK